MQFDEYVDNGVEFRGWVSDESNVVYNLNNFRVCRIKETSDGVVVRAKSPVSIKEEWKSAAYLASTSRPGVTTPEERNADIQVRKSVVC